MKLLPLQLFHYSKLPMLLWYHGQQICCVINGLPCSICVLQLQAFWFINCKLHAACIIYPHVIAPVSSKMLEYC